MGSKKFFGPKNFVFGKILGKKKQAEAELKCSAWTCLDFVS